MTAQQQLPEGDLRLIEAFLKGVGCDFPVTSVRSIEIGAGVARVGLAGVGGNSTITAEYRFAPAYTAPAPEAPAPDASDTDAEEAQ